MQNINAAGIIAPKSACKFKINHYKFPIDFSLSTESQITHQSNIVTLQTVKCSASKYLEPSAECGGSLFIIVEDDKDNEVLDYINNGFHGYNDFLIELMDGNMKTLSKIHVIEATLSSVASELDYGSSNKTHQFLIYFKAQQIQYLK